MTDTTTKTGRRWWGGLAALLAGEVPADTLEAYRRAGRAAYDRLERVEEERLSRKIAGTDPWSVPRGTQLEMLYAWNAFTLQALGDAFLDADYRENPATVGYVPPVTAQQILAFYEQVEPWLSRARQAASNPDCAMDVHLPADLPAWSEVEPCPRAHLEGTLEATRLIRGHAEGALALFQEEGVPEARRPAAQRLRQLMAEASSKADYAAQLWSGSPPVALHEQMERHARAAVERYYHLGQLLAMPSLVDGYAFDAPAPSAGKRSPRTGSARTAALPLPGEPGFDPWILTDPGSRSAWQRDPEAQEAIKTLWRYDPAPRQTLAVQAEIDAAMARGDVAIATKSNGEPIGPYYCCPWAPVYVAKRPVTIGGRRLRTLQQFTLDVSAEEMVNGGPFKREIMTGVFSPTNDVDYCNPQRGGHDD